jgi:hypothetical protein
MTRDEVMKRMIRVEATAPKDRAEPLNVRSRGANHVPKLDPHPSENFDDFFDYEKEFSDLTPARETVSVDIDEFTRSQTSPSLPVVLEKIKRETAPGFIVMEKIPVEQPKSNNIVSNDESLNATKLSSDSPFEFIQCCFIKEDDHRCKKQAKKGQEYCGIHKRFMAKNQL